MWLESRVEANATARQVQKAFRNVSLTLHPDKNPSPTAADEFRRIANAYEVCHERLQSACCPFMLQQVRTDPAVVPACKILNDNATRGDYDYALAHPQEHMLNQYRYYRNRCTVPPIHSRAQMCSWHHQGPAVANLSSYNL